MMCLFLINADEVAWRERSDGTGVQLRQTKSTLGLDGVWSFGNLINRVAMVVGRSAYNDVTINQ